MTPDEVTHFSVLIADLVVAGIRCCDDVARLSEVRAELVESIGQALDLITHDVSASAADRELLRDLTVAVSREDTWSVRA